MISFERAHKIVLSYAFPTGSESVSFMASAGRVLAEKIRSDIDIPPFDKTAVDGYACRREDLGMELEMLEVVSAGMQPEYSIEAATCAKVMTGAPVPEGADFVFMVEDALITDGGKVIFTGKSSKDNISRTGEDVRTGDVVLERGIQIRPQDIAVMASVGCTLVKVSRMPRVGIISTGSELVEPSSRPGMSQIRNSNAYQLLAQAERAGGTGRYYGIAIDEEEVTYQMLTRALEENDVVMLTGGVSMGDFDFVPAVLRRAGVEILFDRVAVQPGKPTTFGVHKNCLVFGLPGNPVSSFIQFELLVRPLIMKMMGCKWSGVEWNVPLAEEYRRKNSSRLGFIPVKINRKGMAVPVEYHGSAHISALPLADGIVAIPEGVNLLEKGEIVNVRQV
ncbi:MAG: molybdopterin molybdotransferase MoeA [Bacteroidales bacterium]|jgi:molybdopterin molybdotransferase|nr:molybdopterin molybdotransferase MoeA [Bacteroidales bacterium]